jgi:hypothetical protein
LKIVIKDGVTTVTADGSKLSCDTATDVEKALGTVTKSVPTGQRQSTTAVVQK